MSDLIHMLIEAGLVQFGRFGTDGKPYQLSLNLLPSYPDVLKAIVVQAVPLIGNVDHLLCVSEAMPFGVGLSLETEIPLVYSRGSHESPVYDLVGAYDIGHPSLLVANCSGNLTKYPQMAEQARRVGLEVDRVLVIVDESGTQQNDLRVTSLLNLATLVEGLVESGELAEGQAQMVQRWLDSHP